MACRRWLLGGLGAWWALAAVGGPAAAQDRSGVRFPAQVEEASAFPTPRVPLEELSPPVREQARYIGERPTLTARGPAETFTCQPAMYEWLLDHPNEAIRLWKQLSAKVTEVEDQGGGRYGWRDGQGNEVWWETVLRTPTLRVWYVEGKAKAGALVPTCGGRGLVVLHHQAGRDATGRPTVRHQAHLLARTDSRALALVARMLGGTAPRLAEGHLSQLEMFYGAMAWYLDQDVVRAERMFRQIGVSVPPGTTAARAR